MPVEKGIHLIQSSALNGSVSQRLNYKTLFRFAIPRRVLDVNSIAAKYFSSWELRRACRFYRVWATATMNGFGWMGKTRGLLAESSTGMDFLKSCSKSLGSRRNSWQNTRLLRCPTRLIPTLPIPIATEQTEIHHCVYLLVVCLGVDIYGIIVALRVVLTSKRQSLVIIGLIATLANSQFHPKPIICVFQHHTSTLVH